MEPILLVFIIFAISLIIGLPIYISMLLSSTMYFIVLGDIPFFVLAQKVFSSVDSFLLLAVPLFILAAKLMEHSGILNSLADLCRALVGHITGGLAHVTITASMFFAGITGCPLSDTAAIGSMLIPTMVREKYGLDFSAAVTVAASIIGPIIPPSIAMILYAFVQGRISIKMLFLVGFIPGIIIGFGLMVVAYFISKKRNYPSYPRATLSELWVSFKKSFLALLAPVIILGGVFSGIFTATESAAVAVGYGLVTGVFITRKLSFKLIVDSLIDSAIISSISLVVLGFASTLSYILTIEQIPSKATNIMMSISDNPYIFLMMINFLLLFLGCFISALPLIIILTPILSPLASSLGIDPIHFGLIVVMNLMIGQITPPVGGCLFVVTSICDTTVERVVKEVFPFFLLLFGVLILVTYVPAISLTIPRIFGYS